MYGFKKHFAMAVFAIAVSSALIIAGQAPAGQRGGQQGDGARGQRGGQPGAGAQQGGAARGQRAAQTPPAPLGLTVTGEVQNFVPVTDAMLRNPDPADWLMIRRDYHASDYSPLNQITRDNVKDLQLVWKSPMNEGGTNQPAPIVHNGVIYLANTGGIMQALDGLTGKVIWENHLGGNIPKRGISHYGNNIHLANRNPLAALDARTGKNVWSTEIAQGYNNSSGPLIVNGKVIEGLGSCQRYQEEKCFMSAYDATNGKQLWRFYTMRTTGHPGAENWGNLPVRNMAFPERSITGRQEP